MRDGERVMVAVSGGLDSMVLLHALVSLAETHQWRLHIAHFNHGLRGRASDADECFVERTARQLNLPFSSAQGQVRAQADKLGWSVEMAARKLRHQFLATTARKFKMRTVAVAHHADDQAELYFLRLLRGAGPEGLTGMKWKSNSPAMSSVRLIRPLLEETKPVLTVCAQALGIRFREDATNAQLDIQRNRVRHELIPLLKTHYQPALNRIIFRHIELLGAEAEFVSQTAGEWLAGKNKLNFDALAIAVQRRALQRQLSAAGVEANFELVEQLRLTVGLPLAISNSREVWREANGRLRVEPRQIAAFDQSRRELHLEPDGGVLGVDGVQITWRVETLSGDQLPVKGRTGVEYFDADKVGDRVILRHWQAGDRFKPLGFPTDTKLQNLFTNLKIPRALRHRLLVGVAGDGDIFWVEGLRPGDHFKLDKQTQRRLHWGWKRL